MTENQLAAPPRTAGTGSARWAILAVVAVGQLMVMLDSTVVNVALPSIQHAFGSASSALQWIVSSYVLFYGSLLLLGGRLSDRAGRRRTFLSGLTVFTLASVGCGLATGDVPLIVFRCVQGVGGAALSAGALSIIVSTYQDAKDRKLALTVWSGLGVVGGTVGVIIGGILVTYLNWRWAFLINLPVGAVTLGYCLRKVPPMLPTPGNRKGLDAPAAVLAAASLLALSYGLISAQNGWLRMPTLAAVAAAIVLLTVLTTSQLRKADPLLPLTLLRIPGYAISGLGLLLASAVMITSFYMTSVYFQESLGYSPLLAGLGIVVMGLPSLVMAFLVPSLIGRIGAYWVYALGATAQLAGCLVMSQISVHSGFLTVAVPGLVLIGLGLPSCFVPLYTIGAKHVRPEQSGVGSGFLNTLNQTGATLGMATVATFAAARTKAVLPAAGSREVALATGFGTGFFALAGVAAVALVIALTLVATQRGRA